MRMKTVRTAALGALVAAMGTATGFALPLRRAAALPCVSADRPVAGPFISRTQSP